MATFIKSVNNESDTPVAYLGTQFQIGGTGWAALGFAPKQSHDCYNWTVEGTQGNQALLTKAGAFYIWDDNWYIFYREAGSKEQKVLTKVQGPVPNIVLRVDSDGKPSATQVSS